MGLTPRPFWRIILDMDADSDVLAGRMRDLVQRCRAMGMNVTTQRLAIYRALVECDDHPSPETLYHRILPQMPALSLATIYKALDALERLGVVREVAVISDSKRLDANLGRHQHLICTRCRKIEDISDQALDSIAVPRDLNGFSAESIGVHILGMCAGCAAGGKQ